jgi:membrane protease YdiL (CAAX protease family)
MASHSRTQPPLALEARTCCDLNVPAPLHRIPWDFALLFILLGVLIPWRGAARVSALLARESFTVADRLATYASTIALQWTLTAFVAWRCYVRGLTLDNLALTGGVVSRTLPVAFGLTLGLAALQLIGLRQTARSQAPPSRLLEVTRRLMPCSLIDSLAFVALAMTAALCEEVLYRGFLFEVILRASSSALAAIVGSSVFFALAHLYQGRKGAITTLVLGAALAASRFWTGSLIPGMAAHLVVDLMAGFLGPHYLRSASGTTEVAPSAQPEGGR